MLLVLFLQWVIFCVQNYEVHLQKISPGWLDVRLPHLSLAGELELALTLGRALRTGKVAWPNVDSDRLHEDEKLMKSALQLLLNQTSTFPRSMFARLHKKNH